MKYTTRVLLLATLAFPLMAGPVPAAAPQPTSIFLVAAGVGGAILMARHNKGQK
jgi:hypothetical protein